MDVKYILVSSIFLQGIALFFILRLVKITGKLVPWVLIGAAIFLMAVRRSITLYLLLTGYLAEPPAASAEMTALAISGLIVAGAAMVGPVFFAIKRSEESLRKSEERFRLLVDHAADAFFVYDLEGKIVDVNQEACKTLGYTREEMLSLSMQDIEESLTPEKIGALFKQMAPGLPVTYESVHQRKNRTILPVEIRAGLFEPGARQLLLATVRDISERKQEAREKEKIQAQLLQAQKMEAIGTLAGGVAHDFNNILTAMRGYADLSMMEVDESDPVYRYLTHIRSASISAVDLVRQLLLFSRKQPIDLMIISLNRIIDDLLKMLNRLIGEDITIKTVLEPELWAVNADVGTIEQVIMNLVVNARDAMPDGGEIAIQTENVYIDRDYCRTYSYARPGKFVCLSVFDTGEGIEKEHLPHIFEPFFSTKELGKGTGLGLSVVYGIVKQHDGWINIHSEPGQGSTFKVYLRAAGVKKEVEREKPLVMHDVKGNGERILLVEDEDRVREFASRVLRNNGYTVFEAANVKKAIDVFEQEKGEFHLLFSDVVLPDKTGLQLVEELAPLKPDLPVLLTSGYTDQKSQWSIIQEKKIPFLRKPYDLNDMLRTVREVLSKKQN